MFLLFSDDCKISLTVFDVTFCFVFFILTVAAAEAAIGLAILVGLFRNLKTVQVDELQHLKG